MIAWAYDEDATIHVFAVPEGALSEGLAAAFAKVPSMGCAFDEIMGGSDVGLELMRIDAATSRPTPPIPLNPQTTTAPAPSLGDWVIWWIVADLDGT